MSQLSLIEETKTPREIFRELRNYLAGQFVGGTRDETLLDELLKCIFCKLYIEMGRAQSISVEVSLVEQAKHIRNIFRQIRDDFSDIYDSNTEILLDPESINQIFQKCSFLIANSSRCYW